MSKSGVARAGNHNHKGKKDIHVLPCQCCWIINDKAKKLDKISLKEMKEELMDQ